ncbi:unnamed protein product [Ceutorhynchus assimilis]|uniref:Cathepsin propeptide inhibitor domain-containing protein n=1 Tax=Ceutorhynchus assimilis TaxID=467358 RepID=A0A9N9MPL1_9CUCU|nr:unnamed protein product [Ceutorhynchus assimilis]
MFVTVFALITVATVAMSAPAPTSDLLLEPVDVQQLWADWKVQHNKNYDTPEEESKRFGIFQENVKKVTAHNKEYQAGKVTWTQGLNQFADKNQEEFAKTYLGLRRPDSTKSSGAQ